MLTDGHTDGRIKGRITRSLYRTMPKAGATKSNISFRAAIFFLLQNILCLHFNVIHTGDKLSVESKHWPYW